MRLKTSRNAQLFLMIFFILFVFFFISKTPVASGMKSFVQSVSDPIFAPVYRIGVSISSHFSVSSDTAYLQSENERLRNENLDLKKQLADLQTAASENERLRKLLDFSNDESNNNPETIARVVARDPDNPSLLLLNAGERDGIALHNAVVVDDGIMIAKIVEVYARSSKALLLTDSASSVAVTVSGGAPSSKIAHGERGLSLILDQVPPGETLTEGQLVITSGLEPAIPKGLIVGEIEQVVSESNDLFQKAILRPLVDYTQTTFVSVMLGTEAV